MFYLMDPVDRIVYLEHGRIVGIFIPEEFFWSGRLGEPMARLRHSYMVMQDVDHELFAESAEAECSFGIRHPERSLAETTLVEFGLGALRERHPNTLSGGQKQRLTVGVGMICGKALMVLDESNGGLGFDGMNRVAQLIRQFSDMGKVIIIVVTHDFEFARRTCSCLVRVDQGRIREDVPVGSLSQGHLRRMFSLMPSDTVGKGEGVRKEPGIPPDPLGG